MIFVHLADIHFHSWSGSPTDTDEDLRRELILDARRVYDTTLGKPNGIFVGGDIAFSGKESEYENAKSWLRNLSEQVGSTLADIWCIPGNHDINQTYAKREGVLYTIHNQIRRTLPQDLDVTIRKYFADEDATKLLFEPLIEYNRFAASFGCSLDKNVPVWERNFTLSGGVTVKAHGLNSSLFSNHEDNTLQKIALGKYQIPRRQDGIVNIVLCHHPNDWWADDDTVASNLRSRARLVLFGHKHTQRLSLIDNSLIMTAGAVHPDSKEKDWEPRYNWFTIELKDSENKDPQLMVRVYPRKWDKDEGKFDADWNLCKGKEFKEYTLKIESPPARIMIGTQQKTVPDNATVPECTQETLKNRGSVLGFNRNRTLTYRYFDLPHIKRLEIACILNLYEDKDEGLQDYEVFSRIFQRAEERKLLAVLWDNVENAHTERIGILNPYIQEKGISYA